MAEKNNTGVFSCQSIAKAISRRHVFSNGLPIEEAQVQPASMDLRLGGKAYRLISSFLPEENQVMDRLHTPDLYGSDLVMYETDISNGGILEKGHVYLIPLIEKLDLPRDVRGRANPKSTTGRLDIFARVLTDRTPRFDDIAPGYTGALFLEVLPRSFTIRLKQGLSLVQLRLMAGDCVLADEELKG